MSRLPSRIALAIPLLLASLWWSTGTILPAHAATDTVTDCTDNFSQIPGTISLTPSIGTLRYEVDNAAAGDTITFACSGSIGLSFAAYGGRISSLQNLTIDGIGQAVTIDCQGASDGAFEAYLNVSLTLRHLTITHCNTASNPGGSGASSAVDVLGNLTVSNVTFTGNSSGTLEGGAITVGFSGATLNVTNSTFSGNTGAYGGAIDNSGTATVTNSTFSGNEGIGEGGAINNTNTGTLRVSNSTFTGNNSRDGCAGAIANGNTMNVTSSTFVGNSSYGCLALTSTSSSVVGGAIVTGEATYQASNEMTFAYIGLTTVSNTILAGNTNTISGQQNCSGTMPRDNGGNLSSDDSCNFTSSKNSATGLLPAPLADNGGPTQTIALLPGSTAINYASCTVSTDQRGFSRPAPGHTRCSSGAFEYGAIVPVSNPVVTSCTEAALRSAINSATPDSTVTFTCSGTITLTAGGGGPITLSKNVTIDGTGHTVTISGGGAVIVFVIPASSGLSVSLKNLTIANGHAPFPSNYAGGITNGATLSVTNSTFSGNSNASFGGAINNTNTGTLSVTNSTFSGNSGGLAGAILNTSTVPAGMSVTNSTFSGNGARAINNASSGSFTLTNTILAGASSGTNCAGSIADKGGNLSNDGSCGFTQSSSKNSVASLNLGPLADNGGLTQTMTLLPGSAAIGAGLLSVCNAAPVSGLDQRGSTRSFPGATTCDSGAYETFISIVPAAFAKWYSDGGTDAGFQSQAVQNMGASLGTCTDLRMISGDFNGDGLRDVLAYCPSTGAFAKWYGTAGTGPQFLSEPIQYAGTNVVMVPADFNGDGKTDILVYRSNDGAFAKWYSDGGVDAGFQSQAVGYVGGAPGAWSNVAMVAADFNGDGKTDILVYRFNDGAFAKWYSDGGVDAGFQSQAVGYVGGAPGAWSNVAMVAADFNGDGKTDILVYRSNDGAFAKWYSDGGTDAGFQSQAVGYVGGAPGAWTNVTMVTADFNGDGKTDILVYRSNDGAFAKWYSDGGTDAGFQAQVAGYVGGAPGAWSKVAMVTADFNGDGKTDILVYRSNDGAFAKWYSDGGVDAGFQGQAVGYVGGAPGAWSKVTMMAADFNGDGKTDILVYHT